MLLEPKTDGLMFLVFLLDVSLFLISSIMRIIMKDPDSWTPHPLHYSCHYCVLPRGGNGASDSLANLGIMPYKDQVIIIYILS
jgi:hypothetical protein